MNVPVQNGDRTEALEQRKRLRAIIGAPAPFLVDHLQRDMRKHHDRRAVRPVLEVGFEPCELLGAEIAESAALQIDDVDEADEVDAVIVVAVPAGALRTLAVAFQIGFAAVYVDNVVLARHPMNLHAGLAEHLVGVIELSRLGKMRDVAGVNDEGRFDWHRLYDGDSLAQRAERIRVRRLVKADMAIAHLQEREALGLRCKRIADQPHRVGDAAAHGPKHPGTRPDHAFQHFPAAQSPSTILKAFFGHVSLSPWAERHQMAPDCAAKQETRPARALFPKIYSFSDPWISGSNCRQR